MPFKNDLAKLIDETHRSKSFQDVAGASPGVLGGLSHAAAAKLTQALDVQTIEQLATSKYVLWAQSITHLARYEKVDASGGQAYNPYLSAILDSEWEKKPLSELVKAPPSIFAGLSAKDAKLLMEGLQVRTVTDLATNRFVLLAQVIAHLAKYEPAEHAVEEAARKAA